MSAIFDPTIDDPEETQHGAKAEPEPKQVDSDAVAATDEDADLDTDDEEIMAQTREVAARVDILSTICAILFIASCMWVMLLLVSLPLRT